MYGDTWRMMQRVDADIRRRAQYDPKLRNSLSVRQARKLKQRQRKKFSEDLKKW